MSSERGKLTRRLEGKSKIQHDFAQPRQNRFLQKHNKATSSVKFVTSVSGKSLSVLAEPSFQTSTINTCTVNVEVEATNLCDSVYEQHYFSTVKSSSKVSFSLFLTSIRGHLHSNRRFILPLTSESFISFELTII